MTNLGRKIRSILRKTKNWHGELYLPQDALVELITLNTVASELGLDTAHPTVQYIVDNAQRLFCIMVLLNNFKLWTIRDAVDKLKEHGLTDNFLPVDYDDNTGEIVSLQGAPRDDVAMKWFSRDVQVPNQNEDLHHNWACDFTEKQWGFLAPIFTKHEAVYPLQDGCPLPFTDYVETGDAGGATSILAQAQVHPEHLKVETAGKWVAIKKINKTNDKLLAKVVQREVAALDLVRRLEHRHLIKFIASYSQQGRHHLIFGWADGGNLKEFWKKRSHTSLGSLSRPQTVQWAIEQMTGLAGALDKLHNPGINGLNCRHGDLKPANVVIATNLKDDAYDLGRLQITDMGLAKVNDHRTHMRQTSGTHSITERYQSPEFRFRISPDTPTSRSFDVWSMGCIMLEFIVWLLYGGNQLDRFNGSFPSTFFDEDGNHSDQVELDPSVIEWISHMKETAIGEPSIENGQCASKALVQVLRLIEEEILVKDEPQTTDVGRDGYVTVTGPDANDADAPATNRRITSTGLMKALEDILRKGEEEGETYFFSVPPSGSSPSSPWPPPPSETTQPGPAPAQDRLRPNGPPSRDPERPGLPRRRSSSFRQGDMHPANTQNEYSVEPMSDYWDAYPDNPLALSVFPYIDTADVIPDHLPNPATKPCRRCSDIFSSHFVFDTNDQPADETCCICQTLSAYLARAPPDGIGGNKARFVRRGSYLARHSAGSPVFSIIVGPGISAAPNDLQRSFPKLPDPGSDAEFAILRRWLKDCDDPQRHRCESKPKTASRVDELPTRLVAVGKTGEPHVTVIESKDCWEDHTYGVRLKAPQPDDPARPSSKREKPELPNLDFVALSHRWAYPPNKESFKLARPVGISTEEDPYKVLVEVTKTKADGTTTTEKKSVQDTYKKWVTDKRRIPLADMPQNFQDAITVTRNLGVPYLWIDSLCIIQGDEADWLREAGRMRHVYNGAYCTVAATRAKLTTEGFLHTLRSQSSQCTKVRTVTPSGREADIYLREAIDDFRKDVEQAELNRRGWVFQERALSRRILHFAGPQVYMECGGGVCCETTTRLFNRPSFFFSDANFPAQAQSFYKGMKIRFYETVYKEYSARDFSVHSDRAVALEGLESKILETYQSAGAYGIIQLPSSSSPSISQTNSNRRTSGGGGSSGIHRSLMWQRNGPKMRRITGDETPEAQRRMSIVPTWSWMKVMGPIRYFDIPMNTVDWSNEDALSSPFKGKADGLMSVQNAEELYIRANVSRLDEAAYRTAVPVAGSMGVGVSYGNNLFVMDCVDSPGHVQGLSCVVIGEHETSSNSDLSMCYVLLVAPTGRPSDGDDALSSPPRYERVGVGRVQQRYVLPVTENGGRILLV